MKRFQGWVIGFLLLCSSAAAQADGNIWLVKNAGVLAGNTVFVLDRSGALIAQHPGPIGGTRGVVKFLDGTVAIADYGLSSVFFYNAAIGLLNGVAAPQLLGISGMSGGNLAVLFGYAGNPLAGGQVRLLSPSNFAWSTQLVATENGPVMMRSGPNDVLWVLNAGSGSVTRIANGVALHTAIATVAATTPSSLTVLPDGRVLVAWTNSTQLTVLAASGAVTGSLNVQTVPHRLVADGDSSVFVLDAGAVVRRFRTDTGALIGMFALPFGSYTGMHLGSNGWLWFEESLQGRAIAYSADGVTRAATLLGAPTTTTNDPCGTELTGKLAAGVDADGDLFTSAAEVRAGTDPLDALAVPPALSSIATPGLRSVTLLAPGQGGATAVLLPGLAGATPALPFGVGETAPYFSLVPDAVAVDVLGNAAWTSAFFSGFGWIQLDAGGSASAAIYVPWWLPPGLLTAALAAVVIRADGSVITTPAFSISL